MIRKYMSYVGLNTKILTSVLTTQTLKTAQKNTKVCVAMRLTKKSFYDIFKKEIF